MRTPTTHRLKTWPRYFLPVIDKKKRFEIRMDDRNFQVGDKLLLQEYDPYQKEYTGREIELEIIYKLTHEEFQGIALGYVALGFKYLY